jgi:segregation and condensation protein A
LAPNDLDLLALVRDYLRYFERLADESLDLASEALPQLARVIELKARLLLPKPPRDSEEADEAEIEQALEAVTLLEELEGAIAFLRRRRDERRFLVAVAAPRPPYPRPERPLKIPLERLSSLAARYRVNHYFELAKERLSMAQAMDQLWQRLKRARRGHLSELAPLATWEGLVVSFAGMLELVKEGKVRARQEAPFAPIELELIEADAREVA